MGIGETNGEESAQGSNRNGKGGQKMSEGYMDDGDIDIDKVINHIKLTKKQRKALTSLKKAFTRCRKLKIGFWDDYGILTAYNNEKMTQPIPNEKEYDIHLNFCMETYALEEIKQAGNVGGNADDSLYFNLKGRKIPRKEEGD